MIKNNYSKIIKIVTLILFLIIIFIDSYVYAGISKYEAYPEWGLIVKVSLISLCLAISITLIGIIVKIILNKFNKENHIINKIINITVLILFCITLISRILVEMDIYNNAIIYLIIATFICTTFILIFRNSRILSNKKLYFIILGILIILLITNQHSYPQPYGSDIIDIYR